MARTQLEARKVALEESQLDTDELTPEEELANYKHWLEVQGYRPNQVKHMVRRFAARLELDVPGYGEDGAKPQSMVTQIQELVSVVESLRSLVTSTQDQQPHPVSWVEQLAAKKAEWDALKDVFGPKEPVTPPQQPKSFTDEIQDFISRKTMLEELVKALGFGASQNGHLTVNLGIPEFPPNLPPDVAVQLFKAKLDHEAQLEQIKQSAQTSSERTSVIDKMGRYASRFFDDFGKVVASGGNLKWSELGETEQTEQAALPPPKMVNCPACNQPSIPEALLIDGAAITCPRCSAQMKYQQDGSGAATQTPPAQTPVQAPALTGGDNRLAQEPEPDLLEVPV